MTKIILSVIVVAFGILYAQYFQSNKNQNQTLKSNSESDKIATAAGKADQDQATPSATVFPTYVLSPKPTNFPKPTPTIEPVSSVSSWIYPDAIVIEQGNLNLRLESGADPQTITDWYKEKIKNTGMNTEAFVQTKTNDDVLNKLAAANRVQHVEIVIAKKSSQQQVTITLKFKQS